MTTEDSLRERLIALAASESVSSEFMHTESPAILDLIFTTARLALEDAAQAIDGTSKMIGRAHAMEICRALAETVK